LKICIVSDSHDRAEPLARAVQAAKELGAEAVIHCSDLIGTQSLRAALGVGLPMHVIHGNHLGDPVSLSRWARESNGQLDCHGRDARLELAGRKIFVVRYPNSCRSACPPEQPLKNVHSTRRRRALADRPLWPPAAHAICAQGLPACRNA